MILLALLLAGCVHVGLAVGVDRWSAVAVRRAQRHEHGVLAVDGVARVAAVEDIAAHHADPPGEVAELLRGADQHGHDVTTLQRASCQQSSGAAGRSYDEYVHVRMVPGSAARGSSASPMIRRLLPGDVRRRSQPGLRLCDRGRPRPLRTG